MGGDKEGEDLLGIQSLCSVLPVSTKKSAVEQEPIHTSNCTLSNENSSDDSSANKQRLSFPSFSPPLTYNHPQRAKFICKEATVRVQGERQHPMKNMWEQECSWILQ